MFPLLPEDGVPKGAIVAIGMDWGEHSKPSVADLQAIWPEHSVAQMDIPISNALVAVSRFTTVQALIKPLYGYGAKRVVVYRMELPKSEGEELGKRILADLENARNFLFGPFSGDDEDGGVFSNAKTAAVTVCVVAGLAGLAIIVFSYMGD